MTFRELMKAYYAGEPGPEGGVRAVVEALRDAAVPYVTATGVVGMMNEILAIAGEKQEGSE
jgi:hypothetical protein